MAAVCEYSHHPDQSFPISMLRTAVFSLLSLHVVIGTVLASEPAKPHASPKAFFTDDPVKWATPKVVLTPTYPKEALGKGVTAVVDATLNLKVSGGVESVAAIASEPKDESFELALKDVLKFWAFAQSYDMGCRPIPALSRIRVWFELKNGEPSISVTHVPAESRPNVEVIEEANRDEVIAVLMKNYPLDARRSQQGADVHTRLAVDPRTGQPRAVEVLEVIGPQANQRSRGVPGSAKVAPRATETLVEQFGNAAREGLSIARFQPTDAHGDGPITVCRIVQYRLK